MGALLAAVSGAQTPKAREIMTDPRRGNCILCHHIPLSGISKGAFGNIGPSLDHVGARLRVAQLRARIVDPRSSSPNTVMPAYGSTQGLYRVQREYEGKTILSDAEIDELAVYLAMLK